MANNRILVVDDEEDLCEILQFNLELEGYTVDVAHSAEEALRLQLADYGLVLLDVMMGEISGFKMAKMMNVPVIGIVENMSYFECPDCKGRHNIFGESNIEALAAEYEIHSVSKIPMNPSLAKACDKGAIELFDGDWLDGLADKVEKI